MHSSWIYLRNCFFKVKKISKPVKKLVSTNNDPLNFFISRNHTGYQSRKPSRWSITGTFYKETIQKLSIASVLLFLFFFNWTMLRTRNMDPKKAIYYFALDNGVFEGVCIGAWERTGISRVEKRTNGWANECIYRNNVPPLGRHTPTQI